MRTFEQQIAESVGRLRHNSDDISAVPPCPIPQRRRPSWGWWATPAAAVAGLLIGWAWAHTAPNEPEKFIAAAGTDTVIIYRDSVKTVHDTVVKRIRIATPSAAVHEHPVAENTVPPPDTMGCDIECDGVSYHLLAHLSHF